MSAEGDRPGFWHTLPGILTATAGVLTAVTGLYLAIVQNRGNDAASSSPPAAAAAAATAPAPQTPSVSQTSGSSTTPRSWAESDAVLTMTDGSQNTVRAASLSNCISVVHAVTLASGQQIPFERMRTLEIVRSDSTDMPNAAATIVVTLLDGKAVNGSMNAGCGWFGYNDIGRFDFNVDRLRRVEFTR